MAQIFQPTERTIDPAHYRMVLKEAEQPEAVVWLTNLGGTSMKVPPIKLKKNDRSNWDVTTWPPLSGPDAVRRINMTKAMDRYCLTKHDLKDLCYVVGVPLPGYSAPHEYLETEVVRRAWEKHGGQHGLQFAITKIKREKKEAAKKREPVVAIIRLNPAAPGGHRRMSTVASTKAAKPKAPAKTVKKNVPRRSPSPVDDDEDLEMFRKPSNSQKNTQGARDSQTSSPARSNKKAPSSSTSSTPQKVPVASIAKPSPAYQNSNVHARMPSPPLTPRKFPMIVEDYMKDIENWSSNVQSEAGPSRLLSTPISHKRIQPYPTPSSSPTMARLSCGMKKRTVKGSSKSESCESVIDLTMGSSKEDQKIHPHPTTHHPRVGLRRPGIETLSTFQTKR